MARLLQTPEPVLRRARRLNGLPQADEAAWRSLPGPWWVRLLTHTTLWWTVLLLAAVAATLSVQYAMTMGLSMGRTEANRTLGVSYGTLAGLVPLALALVWVQRFRVRGAQRASLVAGWAAWLSLAIGAGVTVARQMKVRQLPGGWSATGPLTVGVAVAALVTAVMAALTWASLRRGRPAPFPGRWHWVVLGLGAAAGLGALGWWLWCDRTMPPLEMPDIPLGAVPGPDIVQSAFGKAWPTLLAYVALVVVVIDRRRPVGWLGWLAALGWGAGASTLLSLVVNSWAGELLGAGQTDDGSVNARTAVYIAPFVEEAAKATVLFLLCALLRHRIVNRLNVVALAILSAVGFAFTENIIYYVRAIFYASTEIGAGNADEALAQIAFLRGVLTSWGHPLFTSMTGMGLAIGLRNRSRLVRVLAPLAGYSLAATMHMFFNAQASGGMDQNQMITMMTYLAIGVGITVLSFTFTNWFRENRRIRQRLTDYERMGWLRAGDAKTYSSMWTRVRTTFLALLCGPRTWWRTVSLNDAFVELAYLRDDMTRGLVDRAGLEREKDLFLEIRRLRALALPPTGWKSYPYFWRTWRWARRPLALPGMGAQPALGSATTPVAAASTQYSAVDPSWAPPA